MATKRMDLHRRTFLVLSGCSDSLGISMILELGQRFAAGSIVLLLDENPSRLAELRDELEWQLQPKVQLLTASIDEELIMEQLIASDNFESAIIVHNENEAATKTLIEPQMPIEWNSYVDRVLNKPVAINQRWLRACQLLGTTVNDRLVINVTSSLKVRPLIYNSLLCSCKRARDMYFRAMAAEEILNNVSVLTYSPGVLETHPEMQLDCNGNVVTLDELKIEENIVVNCQQRIKASMAAIRLTNILEEIGFVSGHDVDYYDTFNL